MRVLLAGGAGCLGSVTAEHLVAAGHDVVILDNLVSGEVDNLAGIRDEVAFIKADICDSSAYAEAVGRLDAIIHFAFPTPLCTRDLALQFYDTAARGTANLLSLALRDDAYFIYGSSISVYGLQRYTPIDEQHPTDPFLLYGANKLHGEVLTKVFGQTYGLTYSVLRYTDLYGLRDKRRNAVNAFLAATLADQRLRIFGGGKQRRTLTYAGDAGLATAKVLQHRPRNAVLNVGAEDAVTIRDLAALVRSRYRPNGEIEDVESPQDFRDYVFDSRRLADEIGPLEWTALEDGLDIRMNELQRLYSLKARPIGPA
jgi:nucleoside-diphosphate-sugar epimerase